MIWSSHLWLHYFLYAKPIWFYPFYCGTWPHSDVLFMTLKYCLFQSPDNPSVFQFLIYIHAYVGWHSSWTIFLQPTYGGSLLERILHGLVVFREHMLSMENEHHLGILWFKQCQDNLLWDGQCHIILGQRLYSTTSVSAMVCTPDSLKWSAGFYEHSSHYLG